MPIVTQIQPRPTLPTMKRVGIYCRVSSKHEEQLASLANQVSYFTRAVMNYPGWYLTDIYIDIKSAETISSRPEFLRLMKDCRNGEIDLVITRSISRFGRDTVELLTAIRELRELGIAVLFDEEMISTVEADSEFITTIIEAYAQAENESRSANTKRGLVMRAKNGSSGLYKRRCFGYYTDRNGDLQINDDEATIVRSIFEMYLSGESLVGVIRKLESGGVKTATGKEKWSKNTLDKLLSNEKYCGDVILFKSYSTIQLSPEKIKKRKKNNGEADRYMCVSNHPAIISKETFNAVQTEKARRSNIDVTEHGAKRKSTRYSQKRDAFKTELGNSSN
ncbi:MAG: recombinase family protein [Oscillospiraceae bacterium]|nr:recombinase family protein [Oscillospiraceae bacterium]